MSKTQSKFEAYPYILLNLLLATLAFIQAPIIMMSQNDQIEKDRLSSATKISRSRTTQSSTTKSSRHFGNKIDWLCAKPGNIRSSHSPIQESEIILSKQPLHTITTHCSFKTICVQAKKSSLENNELIDWCTKINNWARVKQATRGRVFDYSTQILTTNSNDKFRGNR